MTVNLPLIRYRTFLYPTCLRSGAREIKEIKRILFCKKTSKVGTFEMGEIAAI